MTFRATRLKFEGSRLATKIRFTALKLTETPKFTLNLKHHQVLYVESYAFAFVKELKA